MKPDKPEIMKLKVSHVDYVNLYLNGMINLRTESFTKQGRKALKLKAQKSK